MTWRDELRPGKLGNASFLLDNSGGQLGRNVQVHEYPGRDTPFVEDLGRKARKLTLDCYVLAEPDNNFNYMPARDALIRELESGGSKTLTHPYHGDLIVSVVDSDGPRESTREGGMARFSITVMESGEHEYLSAARDTAAAAEESASDAVGKSMTAFKDTFNVVGQPDHILTHATQWLQTWADKLQSLTSRVTTLPAPLADFVSALADFSSAVSDLILIPQTLSSKVLALFAQVQSIVAQPAFALEITRDLFNYGDDFLLPPDTGSISRATLVTNQQAMTSLIQQAALLTSVQVVASLEFDSADAALAMRDELMDVFDDQQALASTDVLYFALVDTRAAMVTDLQTRAAQLDKLTTVTLVESVPALVLAFDLYADASRDLDVVARNSVRDPLFMPSGRTLSVVSNG